MTVAQQDSRDHLSMAVLQPSLEVTVGTNLFLLDGVVGGLFLVFFRHLCSGRGSGGCSTKVGG